MSQSWPLDWRARAQVAPSGRSEPPPTPGSAGSWRTLVRARGATRLKWPIWGQLGGGLVCSRGGEIWLDKRVAARI